MSPSLYTEPDEPSPPEAAGPDLLEDLNEAQREAVTAPPGPLLVVAGAGTGKTRVLTRRVAWRVSQGADPRAVLAITFTNKAADVLGERLSGLPGGRAVTAGTFHGFCALLLRRHADRIGGSRDFTILDEEDRRRLVRTLLEDLRLGGARHKPADFVAAISHEKNGGAGRPPGVLADPEFQEAMFRLAPAYAGRLRAAALYDFDDLLLEARRLLVEDAPTRDLVRNRWRHLFVDEYQDTNAVQFDLLRALAGPDPDLTVVGDPDQSIYRWRGASIRNILKFQADFPGARLVLLEQNYRSSAHILAAAEAVIAHNEDRHAKRLFTANASGERILERRYRDGVAEAHGVARILAAWRASGLGWSEMAVILRVNHLSRQLELALREAGIPYEMISGVEFFQRREVKDLLAYARLLENPRDDAAFLRVVNEPRRGVGAGTLERVRALALERGLSVPEAASGEVEGVRGRAREGLDRFLACLARLRARPRAPVAPLLEAIAEETGYRAELQARENEVERARVENLQELVVAARQFDDAHPDLELADFLQQTALVSDQDGFDARAGLVSLMTCHAAKGLEFEGLVVLGVEEGYFPHARSLDRPEDLEEERRLFYVAMTRARRRLVFTHVGQRDVFRGLERRAPSRFLLREIPDEVLDVRDDAGLYLRQRVRTESSVEADASPDAPWAVHEEGLHAPRGRRSGGRGPRAAGRWRRGADAFEEEAAPEADEVVFSQVPPDLPRVGERVAHFYFGPGRLVATSGAGSSLRVTVDFEAAGTKTILWTPALLERLPESEGQA